MIGLNYTSSQYGAYYINEFHKNSAQQNYEEYKLSEKPQKSENFSYDAKRLFTNLGVDTKLIDAKPQSFFDKVAEKLSAISQLYFNKAPEVELAENSIFQRQWQGTLSEAEKQMLNELRSNRMLIPVSENSKLKNIDLEKEEEILLKTTSNVADFVKAYKEILSNYEKEALKEYEEIFGKEMADNIKQIYKKDEDKNSQNANSISTQNSTNLNIQDEKNKKSFTPIQVKSKTQTYTREEINKEFFLNFIENQKENSVNILEFLNKFSPNLKVDLRV